MPKTIKEIWDNLSIHSQQALQYDEEKYALGSKQIEIKWYSEEEVDKIIEQCLNTKIHMEDFKNTGIIRCPICNKKFIKINAYNWKPDCDCFKQNLKLSIG